MNEITENKMRDRQTERKNKEKQRERERERVTEEIKKLQRGALAHFSYLVLQYLWLIPFQRKADP